jgi:hypothetical protein
LREIVTYHGRDFQRESLVREVHLVPVDDVRATMIEPARRAYSLTRATGRAGALGATTSSVDRPGLQRSSGTLVPCTSERTDSCIGLWSWVRRLGCRGCGIVP